MSDDDRALMERLAALEAEVKAEHDQKQRVKEAALAKVKAERDAKLAEQAALRERQTALVKRKPVDEDDGVEDLGDGDEIGGALALAKRAHGVKQELARAPKEGEKSWIKSGLASMLLGPLGWLYAGSWREAVPASAGWLAIGALASKLIPMFLLMPVMMVVLPLSGIAGAMYAVQYNRTGKRQRLFKKKGEPPKALPAAAPKRLR